MLNAEIGKLFYEKLKNNKIIKYMRDNQESKQEQCMFNALNFNKLIHVDWIVPYSETPELLYCIINHKLV